MCNLPKPLDLSLQSGSEGTQGLRPSHCKDLLHVQACVHISTHILTEEHRETCTKSRMTFITITQIPGDKAISRVSLQVHR